MRNLNLNNSYYETLDKNFKEALMLVDKDLTHNELISMLKDGNIPQKQLAALRLENITTIEDANILLNNLVGQDGKVREVVSIKIKEFSTNPATLETFLLLDKNVITDYFLAAIIDINGNICRNILETLEVYKNNSEFATLFIKKLLALTHNLINTIEKFEFTEGKYKINKEVFKLYWCLEAINIFYDVIPLNELKNILKITKNINEYTIREKTAKILSNKILDEELIQIKKELDNDENYYVRRYSDK